MSNPDIQNKEKISKGNNTISERLKLFSNNTSKETPKPKNLENKQDKIIKPKNSNCNSNTVKEEKAILKGPKQLNIIPENKKIVKETDLKKEDKPERIKITEEQMKTNINTNNKNNNINDIKINKVEEKEKSEKKQKEDIKKKNTEDIKKRKSQKKTNLENQT